MSGAPRSATHRSVRRFLPSFVAVVALAVLLVGCSEEPGSDTARQERKRIEVGKPYPYSEPAPPDEQTPIDGTYARTISVEQAGGEPVYCQRCAPWRLDAGEATLLFDHGELYADFEPIHVEVNCESKTRNLKCKHPPGFHASAHYRVDGDRVEIFNDPNCIGMTGVYEWDVEDDELVLTVVEDECPFVQLRSKYLTAAPWEVSAA